MKTLLAIVLLFFSYCGYSQQQYFILDDFTGQPIPFVKVFPNTGTPFLSDIDGMIELNSQVESIRLTYSGYPDTTIAKAVIEDHTIHFKADGQLIDEMVVTPGINPAHRIMRNAINNRKKNHPLGGDAFTYESYSKLILDINRDALTSIPDSTTDTSLIQLRTFFDEQHLFLMESASKRTFKPPFYDKEEIIAYKVSGLQDPRFSTFANSLQSFSFYENQFDLLGKNYINPLARGGINRYLFILEDTTIVEKDTTFTIFYRPRKGKNFDGLTGRLYINTNGFAVERVIASPYKESSGIELKIIQEYELIDGKKWFPSKLSTEIEFRSIGLDSRLNDGYIQGRGHSYIKDIQLNPAIKKKFNDNIVIQTNPEANDVKNEEWEEMREYKTTNREQRTYAKLDSLSEEAGVEDRINRLSSLLEGKVPVGKWLTLDLSRVARYNCFEGIRLGLGLETSREFSKHVTFGGYFGYGLKDRDWKYGGHSTLNIYRKRGVKLELRYQQDVEERGGARFSPQGFGVDPLSFSESARKMTLLQMDRQRLAEVALSTDIKANIELKLIGNYQHIDFTENYRYLTNNSLIDGTRLVETGAELTWNFGEKYMLLGDEKRPVGERDLPRLKVRAMKGWNTLIDGEFDYVRLNAELSQRIQIRALGKLTWKLTAATTMGEGPLFIQHSGNGTGKSWFLSAMNTFETMAPGEFYNTSQVSVFARFMFLPIKTEARWNEPQFGLHHAMGYGEFKNRSSHQLPFRSTDRGYFESGLIINGLLTAPFASLGIGGFYNYGEYAKTDWYRNIVPKLQISLSIGN